MNILKTSSMALAVSVLAACGGGGSSSGGSPAPAASVPTAPPPPSVQGTYSGTWTATFDFQIPNSGPPTTESIRLSVIIDGQNVEVTDGDFRAFGSLSATNGYNASTGPDFVIQDSSISCRGELTFGGVADGTTAQGNTLGRLGCRAFGTSFTAVIDGPYTTSKSSTKVSGGGSLLNAIRSIAPSQL